MPIASPGAWPVLVSDNRAQPSLVPRALDRAAMIDTARLWPAPPRLQLVTHGDRTLRVLAHLWSRDRAAVVGFMARDKAGVIYFACNGPAAKGH